MKIGSVGGRAVSRFKMSENDSRDALACTVMHQEFWHCNSHVIDPFGNESRCC